MVKKIFHENVFLSIYDNIFLWQYRLSKSTSEKVVIQVHFWIIILDEIIFWFMIRCEEPFINVENVLIFRERE
jgi:hypothetical protein